MCRSLPFWLVIATCLLWPPIQAQAETISEKLTAAIYQEETAGNLPQAIKIYREIVDEGKSAAEVAAKAQWRLAMCLKKMGKSSEARAERRIAGCQLSRCHGYRASSQSRTGGGSTVASGPVEIG